MLHHQSARRLNIASLQNIIAYEYLPAFLGEELAPHTSNKADIMCASQRRLGKELAPHTSNKADIMGASQRRLGKKLAPNTSVPVSRV